MQLSNLTAVNIDGFKIKNPEKPNEYILANIQLTSNNVIAMGLSNRLYNAQPITACLNGLLTQASSNVAILEKADETLSGGFLKNANNLLQPGSMGTICAGQENQFINPITNSLIVGHNQTISETNISNAIVLGHHNKAQSNALICGYYAAPSHNSLLTVGNGDTTAYSNAFEVNALGHVYATKFTSFAGNRVYFVKEWGTISEQELSQDTSDTININLSQFIDTTTHLECHLYIEDLMDVKYWTIITVPLKTLILEADEKRESEICTPCYYRSTRSAGGTIECDMIFISIPKDTEILQFKHSGLKGDAQKVVLANIIEWH